MPVELSARVEYALLALLEMASRYHQKEPLKISEITENQTIPDRYLEQILTSLKQGGIVQSYRGAKGGYVLTREPWRISLLEVVVAVEGDRSKQNSSAALTVDKSLVLEIWQQAKTAAQTTLEHYTLEDLCHRRNARLQNGPMYYI